MQGDAKNDRFVASCGIWYNHRRSGHLHACLIAPPANLQEETMDPSKERKPYEAPAVIYESELEVRAGSPFGIPDPLDLTGAGSEGVTTK